MKVVGVSYDAMAALIHFLHCGKLPQNLLEGISGTSAQSRHIDACGDCARTIMELCFCADEYLLPQLASDAAVALEAFLTPINASDVLGLAHLLRMPRLRAASAAFILSDVRMCCASLSDDTAKRELIALALTTLH